MHAAVQGDLLVFCVESTADLVLYVSFDPSRDKFISYRKRMKTLSRKKPVLFLPSRCFEEKFCIMREKEKLFHKTILLLPTDGLKSPG